MMAQHFHDPSTNNNHEKAVQFNSLYSKFHKDNFFLVLAWLSYKVQRLHGVLTWRVRTSLFQTKLSKQVQLRPVVTPDPYFQIWTCKKVIVPMETINKQKRMTQQHSMIQLSNIIFVWRHACQKLTFDCNTIQYLLPKLTLSIILYTLITNYKGSPIHKTPINAESREKIYLTQSYSVL